ncbi:MAG: glycosyltransferase [Acetobacteraceae bacterium]|nr:glycosyltransferase [Acetobacteraceae bacterium]
MAKIPRAGYSKTRLCPPLTPEQAGRLSGAFLRDTTENVLVAALVAPITGYAAYAPFGAEASLRPYLAPGTLCVPADGKVPVPPGVEGFGRCLFHAMQRLFAPGHVAACVLSSDTPTLPTAALVRAAELLLTGDDGRVVLGACDDGGYYLLGMRMLHAGLFTDIPWSTDTVAQTTRARATALGLDLLELPPWYDIDDPPSLVRLLGNTEGYAAPWTRRAIQTLGLKQDSVSSTSLLQPADTGDAACPLQSP